MGIKPWATVLMRDGERIDMPVAEITTVGILVDNGGGYETLDVLIPWHRVVEVYSNVEGMLSDALKTVTGK